MTRGIPMSKQQGIALAAALVPALGTVYLDTLPPGRPWTWDVWALDLLVVLACWHVIALGAMHVGANVLRGRPARAPVRKPS